MKKFISIAVLGCFFLTSIMGLNPVCAQELRLPAPGVMVHLSSAFNPPILKGIKVHPDNPFRFDFILDQGDSYKRHPEKNISHPEQSEGSQQEQLKSESTSLIKYFLASLTIPEKDLWVNLSPYENNRIIPQSFGLTEMGRDLLAEDYMLKQITASLVYPEDAIGKKFWKRIYEEAAKKFGTTNVPVNTFNKVWILPEKAVIYENAKAGTAYIVESKLKVMLEQDYLAIEKNQHQPDSLSSSIIREIIIPELTKEINQGQNFSQLRQVYNSLILATWYKKKIKDSILAQVYEDKKKIKGVEPLVSLRGAKGDVAISDTEIIYQRYLQAFKKGVYNYIKEEADHISNQPISRKYFSGGAELIKVPLDFAMANRVNPNQSTVLSDVQVDISSADVPIPIMSSSRKSFVNHAMITFEEYLVKENKQGGQEAKRQIAKAISMIKSGMPILIDVGGGDTKIALAMAQNNPGIAIITFDTYKMSGNRDELPSAIEWQQGILAAQKSNLPNVAVLRADAAEFFKHLPDQSISEVLLVNSDIDVLTDLLLPLNPATNKLGYEGLLKKLKPISKIVIKSLPQLTEIPNVGNIITNLGFKPIGKSYRGVDLIEASKRWKGAEKNVYVLDVNQAMTVSLEDIIRKNLLVGGLVSLKAPPHIRVIMDELVNKGILEKSSPTEELYMANAEPKEAVIRAIAKNEEDFKIVWPIVQRAYLFHRIDFLGNTLHLHFDDPSQFKESEESLRTVLMEPILNALQAQKTGKITVQVQDNRILVENKGFINWGEIRNKYHKLIDENVLYVSRQTNGSIKEFERKTPLNQGRIDKHELQSPTKREVDDLFNTPEGLDTLFFARRGISFADDKGTKEQSNGGWGMLMTRTYGRSIGAELKMLDDGNKSGKVLFEVKFSNDTPFIFVNQAMKDKSLDINVEKWERSGFWTSSEEESAFRQEHMPNEFKRISINSSLENGSLPIDDTNLLTINDRRYLLIKDFHQHHPDISSSYFSYQYDQAKNQVFGDPVVIKTISRTRVPSRDRYRSVPLKNSASVKKVIEMTDRELDEELNIIRVLNPKFPIVARSVKVLLDSQGLTAGGVHAAQVMPYYGQKLLGDSILELLNSDDPSSGLQLVRELKEAYLGLFQVLEAQKIVYGRIKFVVTDLDFLDDFVVDAYSGRVVLLDLGRTQKDSPIGQFFTYTMAYEYTNIGGVWHGKSAFFSQMNIVLRNLGYGIKNFDEYEFLVKIFDRIEESIVRKPQSAKELSLVLPEMIERTSKEMVVSLKDMIRKYLAVQRAYGFQRINFVGDSLNLHFDEPSQYTESETFLDSVLTVLISNALQAQKTGKITVQVKDNRIIVKNKGHMDWQGIRSAYHQLIDQNLLYVSYKADGSIEEFLHKNLVPIKSTHLFKLVTKDDFKIIDDLFTTPVGLDKLFFDRRGISFSKDNAAEEHSNSGIDMNMARGYSRLLGGELRLVDDGNKSGEVSFEIKFSSDTPFTFVNQAMAIANAYFVPRREVARVGILGRSRIDSDRDNFNNYLRNNNEVRSYFLQLLEDIKDGRVDREGFRLRFEEMHRIMLVGIDGNSIYIPPTVQPWDEIIEQFKSDALRVRLTSRKTLKVMKQKIVREMLVGKLLDHDDPRIDELFNYLKDFENLRITIDRPGLEKLINLLVHIYFCMIKSEEHPYSYLFERCNHSLLMDMINGMIRLYGLNGIPHPDIDENNDLASLMMGKFITPREAERIILRMLVNENPSLKGITGSMLPKESFVGRMKSRLLLSMRTKEKTGGIDMSSVKGVLRAQNSGEGIQFHLNPAMLTRLQNSSGFVPVIINIQPLINLRLFLGINDPVAVDKSV
jgi:hypothetical protein